MTHFKRIFLIVMDSVGIGEAPDAATFNDNGADTLGHIAEHMNGLKMPHMGKLGLSNIRQIKGIEKADRSEERRVGKEGGCKWGRTREKKYDRRQETEG